MAPPLPTTPGAAATAAADDVAAAGAARRRDAANPASIVAPRWYVTQGEFNALASYMRGRLTLEKVNAALDEAALHAEQLARWMALVRAHNAKGVPVEERRRATDMYHSLAVSESGGQGRWGTGLLWRAMAARLAGPGGPSDLSDVHAAPPPPTHPPTPQSRVEGIKGNYFFTETELRNGAALRPDKTGKGILMILRHLGRISEVRGGAGRIV